VQSGLNAAVTEKQQILVRFIEGLWDKYHKALTELRYERTAIEVRIDKILAELNYS
jgi:hypothetical protein